MGVGFIYQTLEVPDVRKLRPHPNSRRGASHPFGGEKVHWTFSSFSLTPLKGG